MSPHFSKALTVCVLAIACVWSMQVFASLYSSSTGWFDHVIAFVALAPAFLFGGIVFQFTMNSPERQASRTDETRRSR